MNRITAFILVAAVSAEAAVAATAINSINAATPGGVLAVCGVAAMGLAALAFTSAVFLLGDSCREQCYDSPPHQPLVTREIVVHNKATNTPERKQDRRKLTDKTPQLERPVAHTEWSRRNRTPRSTRCGYWSLTLP